MKYLKSQNGFLLVEAIAAMVIVSVALLAISNIFIHSKRAVTTANGYTDAVNIAQQQLDIYKTQPDTFWAINNNTNLQPYDAPNGKVILNNIEYTVKAVAKKPAGIDDSKTTGKLVQVTVNVAWQDSQHNNEMRQVELTSLFLYNQI